MINQNIKIGPEGSIERTEKGVVVRVPYSEYVAALPDVECENPEAEQADRIYRKTFYKKPVYLSHEYDQAIRECLSGNDVVVIGMNGYSRISDASCLAWGVTQEAYEEACAALLGTAITAVQSEFHGMRIKLTHGASNLGVDRAILMVAQEFNLHHLGHSCPKFMPFVSDDNAPIYVAETQHGYADAFVRSLHILISANGRLQAFQHDISAAFQYRKHIIPVNVMRCISTKGGPPVFGPDGSIEDAVAAFEFLIHQQMMRIVDGDSWRGLEEHISKTMLNLCRNMLSPKRAFGRWRET